MDYRYTTVIDVGHYHRFAIGGEAQTKWKKFEFIFRPMLQKQNQYFLGDDEQKLQNSTYLRPRVKVQYKINKRVDVYIYGEPFVNVQQSNNIDWWQNTCGLKYEYTKNQKVNFFYIWQPDYSHNYFYTYNIFGVDLDFTIKVGKKKKGKKDKKVDLAPS
ncbi:MAG TPA: hypothetical protein DGG95_10315 [Cytophagales bacterium]|nr:hypothetical protein [Cytophagales bacterium]